MALAYISFAGINNGQAELYADIGTNKFYSYKIGQGINRTNGLNLVEQVRYTSPLIEQPEQNPFNSRFMIRIPISLFEKSKEYVQLYSYGSRDGTAPAISEPKEVNAQAGILNNEWPLLAGQSKQMSMSVQNNYETGASFNPCRTVSFSFAASKFSNAMFWDSLLQAAKVLAPVALKALPGLLNTVGGGTANAGTTNTGTGTTNPAPASDDIMKLITAIVSAIGNQPAQQPPTGTTTPPAPPVPAPAPSLTKSLGNSVGYSNGLSYKRLRKARSYSKMRSGFSKQQFIDGGVLTGPLLASLLGPVIQAAPQLLQVLGDTPVKWLNAKNEGDLKKQMADNAYLQNLLSQHNQNTLLQLLANTGQLNKQNPPVAMSFSDNKNINVSFEAGPAVMVSGKQKFVYSDAGPVKLLLHFKTTSSTPPSRPIPRVIVQLKIKDALQQKLLLEKKYRITNVHLNSMIELELLPKEVQDLPHNTDLLVSAAAIWPTKTPGKNEGCSNVHAIYIVSNYFLKHFGDKTGDNVVLGDIAKYRVFANKIWEGSGGQKRKWETLLDTRYYIYYQPKANSNGRVESKLKAAPQEEENQYRMSITGKLKSGLEVSPVELNKLIPMISKYPVLTEPQLSAFKTDDLQRKFNLEAKATLELRGLKHEAGAVWTFPEVAMHKVILSKATRTNETGQVTEITDEEVYFPFLNSIHFAGIKTE